MFLQTPVRVECHSLLPPMHELSHHRSRCPSLASFLPHLPLKTHYRSAATQSNCSPLFSIEIWPDCLHTAPHRCWQRLHPSSPPASHSLTRSGATNGKTLFFLFFFTLSANTGVAWKLPQTVFISAAQIKKEEREPGRTE